MPFGKELAHLIEEQINKVLGKDNNSTGLAGIASRSGGNDRRIAMMEANLQRLSEKFANFVGSQKNSKRNIVDYGLNVIALHDLRIAVMAGRAIFVDNEEPLDLPYTYLQLANAGAERQLRYIYVNSTGVVLETTTDPTNMGKDYLPLAMIDVWSGISEITQDKIKDLRPRAGSSENSNSEANYQLTGNATLSVDTGNDSFVVSATNPAELKVNVSSGRALVNGEILNAEGGLLDLLNHQNVVKEFMGFNDGVTTTFNLYHKSVSNVVVYVNNETATVTVDGANGSITFATAPVQGARIEVSYTFGGNYMLLFLVEKALTNDGSSFGVINWKVGSNRSADQPPALATYQHAIAKVDMSGAITAITDALIDNSYEVKNLTQYDLQYGGNLGGSSIKANSITGDHIIAGSIESAHISTGAITAEKIKAGAIRAEHIDADSIRAEIITTGSISADKFTDSTWGDMSQAMRFVKSILGGEQAYRCILDPVDLSIGESYQVAVNTQSYPSLCLGTVRQWDDTSNWDTGTWDIPVHPSGYWVSASFDYGSNANLQAEFWAKPLMNDAISDAINDATVQITVKAKYCQDNLYTRPANVTDEWQDYEEDENQSYCETLLLKTAGGYLYWTGSLRGFRYFKFKVIFETSDINKYKLLANPEVRAANCQIGTEDINDAAVTAPKLAAGALGNNIAILTGSIGRGGTIPLPDGYTQNQCKWIVSFREMYFSGTVDSNDSEYCFADENRVVSVYGSEQRAGFIANYLIVGVK